MRALARRAGAYLLGALLLVALLAGAALLWLDFDSPHLGETVLHRAGEATGLVLEAEGFRLNLLRGLELTGVTAFATVDDRRLDVEAERLVFRHRLLPLLAGRLELTSAYLERPRIELLEGGPGAAAAARESRDWTPTGARPRGRRRRGRGANEEAGADTERDAAAQRVRSVEIHALYLRDARLVFASGPYPTSLAQHAGRLSPAGQDRPLPRGVTEVVGLDLDLRELRLAESADPPLLGASARGRLHIDAVRAAELTAERLQGTIDLLDGRLSLTDLDLWLDAGRLRVEELKLRLDEPGLPYTLRLAGDRLDSGRLLAGAESSGLGTSALLYRGDGKAADGRAARGAGRLTVRGGTLPAVPLFTTIDRFTGGRKLVGAPYEEVVISFRLAGERLEVEPFDVVSGPVRLRVEGWTQRSGALSLETELSAPRDRVEIDEVPGPLLDRMTDEEGRVRLTFRVGGTRDSPRVEPDLPELTRRDRRELEKKLERKLKEGLRRLFGGDDAKDGAEGG